MNDTDWMIAVDNTDCAEWDGLIAAKRVKLSQHNLASYGLWAVIWLAVVGALICVCATWMFTSSTGQSKAVKIAETAPLLPSF